MDNLAMAPILAPKSYKAKEIFLIVSVHHKIGAVWCIFHALAHRILFHFKVSSLRITIYPQHTVKKYSEVGSETYIM